jgi:hypothetical protein
LAQASPGQAAPDCKTSPNNPACAASKAAKSSAEPRPRPEPEVVRRPQAAHTQAAAKKPRQHPEPRQTARHPAPHRAYARSSRDYRLESRRDRHGREYRAPSGPVYGSAPGAVAGGYGCDEACQYRAWFEHYSAWYDRYGRTYNVAPRDGMRAARQPSYGPDYRYDSRTGRTGQSPDQSERDRLDPWHGYNSRDGLENGY